MLQHVSRWYQLNHSITWFFYFFYFFGLSACSHSCLTCFRINSVVASLTKNMQCYLWVAETLIYSVLRTGREYFWRARYLSKDWFWFKIWSLMNFMFVCFFLHFCSHMHITSTCDNIKLLSAQTVSSHILPRLHSLKHMPVSQWLNKQIRVANSKDASLFSLPPTEFFFSSAIFFRL